MNIDRLRHDLTELAEEVTTVDLRDRVLRTSHRLGIQRAMAMSATAVVMFVAATGTAYALLPRPASGPSPAQTPSVTHPAPPDPTPSTAATTGPTPSTPPASTLSGTVYYLMRQGEVETVYSLRDGRTTKHLSVPANSCASNSLSLSPDGRLVAWIAGDNGNDYGDLTVASIDGARTRVIRKDVYCLGAFPAWSADSRQLWVILSSNGAKGTIDVDSQKFTPVPDDVFARYGAWSPNGAFQAYRDGNKIVVATSNGNVVRMTEHDAESPTGGFTVQGVSDDGRYVVVGQLGSDPSRVRTGATVVDVVTGDDVDLPVDAPKGGRAVFLLPGGAMLIRIVNESGAVLHEVSATGAVTTVTEPAELARAQVLGHRP